MADYKYCCSSDGHGLSYPGFSVVFIQTFSIHHSLNFCVDEDYVDNPDNLRASEAGKPMVYRDRHIEHQIFVRKSTQSPLLPGYKVSDPGGSFSLKSNAPVFSGKTVSKVRSFPQDSVYRFALRGFNFDLLAEPEDAPENKVRLTGHVSVEMSLFFGHTVSLTYRFLFDGDACKVLDEHGGVTSAGTDHLISLLSTYLGAEFWSRDKDKGNHSLMASQSDINLETSMVISDFWFKDDGTPIEDTPRSGISIGGKGRTFDRICSIYKRYIYDFCTAYGEATSDEARKDFASRRGTIVNEVRNDLHYAMVDIWESVQHFDDDGKDLFSNHAEEGERLSEAEIINHIKKFHKPELIGLMTLYPGEWPYRDAEAFDEVCGNNIAIDTDDLVLVGHNMAVVIGTYGRRGSDMPSGGDVATGVDWSDHLKERRRYHVSWPEYLMILQMVLAKKYRIGLAKEQMIGVTLKADDSSAEKLIEKNAELSMRLSRMILQLDVVKYSKFASHVVMFDRTTKRLGLEKDVQELREIMSMVDDSLQNLGDYKAMKSDFFMNIILGIISVVSTFEIMFQAPELPFLTYFNIPSGGLAAWIVVSVTALVIFALLFVIKNFVTRLWGTVKKR